jgi:hypothetical protein
MLDQDVSKDEQAAADKMAAKRKAEAFSLSLTRMTNEQLDAELRQAEFAGDARAMKAIKATREAKDARDRARIIRASKRAIEACERTGTEAQLKAEQARLASYEAGGPLPDSVR